jgi:hypothetical protein
VTVAPETGASPWLPSTTVPLGSMYIVEADVVSSLGFGHLLSMPLGVSPRRRRL